MKIVSLLPSATEIAFALGLDDELVAVTAECDHPPAAASKPKASHAAIPADGGLDAAEVDRLVSQLVAQGEPLYRLDTDLVRRLQPDVILAQDLCRVCAVPSGHVTEALDSLGCRADVVSLDPATLDDVISCVEQVGQVTDRVERAAAVAAGLRADVAAVRAMVAGLPRRRVLTLEWREPPFGGGHWVPDMVDAAGGTPVLATAGTPSRRVTWDDIAAAAPEVVVFMPCGYGLDRAVDEGRGLAGHPALAGADVFAVDASAYFSRPSPRIVEGVEILAWCLHPDVVPAPGTHVVAQLG